MRRRKTAIFFLVLGIVLSVLAVALNIGWIILNVREVVLLVLGIIFFALIITGLILNTIFLVREIRRNEQHDAFLNAVTHELKTPIASIKLYLETLKTRELTKEKREEFYDIMLSDNKRLLNTVEQVLQASRTREKSRPMNLAEIDLGELIVEAIATIRNQRHLGESDIRFTGPSESVKVLGDRLELHTAIVNLLENAFKYSGAEPRVSIRLKPASKNKAEIYVRDNGIGIARSDLKRIFKRFYRVPNASVDAAKGTGLGLAIVRSIVEKHGGRIRAQSKGEGKGSTFIIQLPRNRA
ncbi:MAG TPA: HAMP domain-containing sensor histidine kinase [Pyrinomonadaceae bacterium]|nr:ATP-binding protein [Chloracidobacterium sp.]MBP9934207.1 ATP-binding protein [Pyrinomonadaceae bacterium]MBK7801596.1 ATP-binding protein [Chloracidobacterium sp.]MBK9436913.1 ATP-binding protein [Chloracidobacterium sp.]MBL0241906.1 ATP-binding protein [Chloracidobacterium sp.]